MGKKATPPFRGRGVKRNTPFQGVGVNGVKTKLPLSGGGG
jgi:hypothetical protein